MKLSKILLDYRDRLQISQRELSRRCGLSNSYISFIENEYNPKTGKPIVPTIEQYQKLASGMGMTVHQLFSLLDEDSPVDLHVSVPVDDVLEQPATLESRIISGGIDRMPPERREQALKILQVAFAEYADYFKEDPNHDA